MPGTGKIALAVVAGGLALGAVLGGAASPRMKPAPEQPWRAALQPPIVAAEAGYLMIEAGPEDLSPYRDSYAPTWANEGLADAAPEYPAWTYSDFADEPPAPESAEPTIPPPAAPALALAPPDAAPLAPEPRVAGNLAALY